MTKYLHLFNQLINDKINLRRGERKKVFLLQGNIFLIISILLILKPLFTSVLLSFHGISIMPTAYIGIAISAILVHGFISYFTNKQKLIKLIYYNNTIQIIVLTLISISLYFGIINKWISLGLYIYISIFALVTVSYFYQYCQSLLTIRDAKRVYAFIGSGAIAGGVFGGYYTSIFIPIIGNTGLVLSAVLLMSLSFYIMYILHNAYMEDEENTLHVKEDTPKSQKQLSIIKNHHIKNIVFIIGLGVVVSKLVDYQFNYLAYEYITGEEALTSFFGFWFSTINVVGLMLQMLIVTKVIDRLGVARSLAVMPFFLLVGGIMILIFPILTLGVIMKLIEGSLKQSLYKTSTEINIMPFSASLRNRAKTFVDVVVDSLATGAAGIAIYVFINKGNLPFYWIGIISISTTLAWLLFIYQSNKTYKIELAKMVKGEHLTLDESERVGSVVKKRAIDQYLNESKIKGKTKRNTLLKLTKHEDMSIRKSAILRYVSNYGVSAIEDLKHAFKDPSILVRKSAFFARIMAAKDEKQVDAIYKDLSVENYIIVTAALAEAIGNNTEQKRIYKLHGRIDEAYNKLTFDPPQKNIPKYLGQIFQSITISKYVKRYPLIKDAIKNSADNKVQNEALKAVGYGKARRFFDALDIGDISPENITTFYKTISVFPKRLYERLIKYKNERPKKLVTLIPAIEYVDRQRHVDLLFSLLDHSSLKIRRTALKVINACRNKYPHLSFDRKSNIRRLNREIKQLKNIASAITYLNGFALVSENNQVYQSSNSIIAHLYTQANRTVLSIFIYLTLITKEEELSMIYRAIKSTRKDAALDLLDGILNYRTRKRLLPILELVVHKKYTLHDAKRIGISAMNDKKLKAMVVKMKNEKLTKLFFEYENNKTRL